MLPHKDVTFPPLTPSKTQRLTFDQRLQHDVIQTSEEGQEEKAGAVSVQPAVRKVTRNKAGSKQLHQTINPFPH
ncbi:KN motif and ankyrin repeat domain containing protein 3 [Dissostichus eleginoides]|uniref:KN motif and ankyrin repeat domain containing protein 3 n=1 Tax=Dissostichus eleginoides TaxID=100907 RepID=A0AAD9F3Z0_DISEL|nr:KN motif and ankyrin repeat domain containing protein 3 [Dissostichus eleginoides]